MNARFPMMIVVVTALAAVTLSAGCGRVAGYQVIPIPADKTLEERVLFRAGGWTSDKIALVDLNGVLINGREASLFGEGEQVVSLFTEKLQRAAADKKVKAVVLRINSPGGSATASDLIYEEVRRFRQNTDKKVIAMCMDVAASGGYYVACAAEEIVAQPTGVVGSIGVVVMLPDLHGLMDKVGVDVHVVKSGRMKDAGSPFRLLEPDEREYFQTMVNDLFERFVTVVDDGRPQLDTEQVRALADGRVFTANQALENGLVDRIGTLHDAIAIAREAAGLKQAHVVMYHRPLAWTPTIYAQAQTPPNQPSQSLLGIDVIGWWHRMRSPFLYLWCPGM